MAQAAAGESQALLQFQWCANARVASLGKYIHAHVIKNGHTEDTHLDNILLQMYGNCNFTNNAYFIFDRIARPNIFSWTIMITAYAQNGNIEEAREIFNKMHERNVVSWTAMISAYAQHGLGKEALQLFQEMQMEGMVPNKVTFVSILSAWDTKEAFSKGKHTHAHIIKNGFHSDVIVGNALVTMYEKCSGIDDAHTTFCMIPEKTLRSWNTMLVAYVHYNFAMEALELLKLMASQGLNPDKVALVSSLSACESEGRLPQGKWLHSFMENDVLESEVIAGTALICMYCKCGNLETATALFNNIREPNVVTWNVIIACYCQHGLGKIALELFQQMELEGLLPNIVTFVSILGACTNLTEGREMHKKVVANHYDDDETVGNALLTMYSKFGNMDDIHEVFDKMATPNVISWNILIASYVQHGHSQAALLLVKHMELTCVMLNKVTFLNILHACSIQAALTEGREMHAQIIYCGLDLDIVLANALVDMYGTCGSLEDACRVFFNMTTQGIVSWNALLAAYASHGDGAKSLQLFQQMQLVGISPDIITFISILNACSHVGSINNAGHLFTSMTGDHSLVPSVEQYHCIVDLLGRVGWLDESENLIDGMPFISNTRSWTILLAASAMLADKGRAIQAALHLRQLEPTDATSYVLLSKMYATVK